MRAKHIMALAAAGLTGLALGALLGGRALAAGGSGDPLVTRSFLNGQFVKTQKSNAQSRADELLAQARETLAQKSGALETRLTQKLSGEALNKSLLKQAVLSRLEGRGGPQEVSLFMGDRLVGKPGAGLVMTAGTANVIGPAASEIIDVTAGAARKPGTAAGLNQYYMVTADNDSGLVVTSDTAQAQLMDGWRVVRASTPQYENYAQALKNLGLFNGTNHGFELGRQPTRQESLIMLIRLMGEEPVAQSYAGKSIFTDLTGWAGGASYVSYGVSKKYTDGVSPTLFAPHATADENVYFTYLLRALGYDDKKGDFVWNQAGGLAVRIGLLTQGQLDEIAENGFVRDHVALLSFHALSTPIKGGSQTLGQRLVAAGVITQQQLTDAMGSY